MKTLILMLLVCTTATTEKAQDSKTDVVAVHSTRELKPDVLELTPPGLRPGPKGLRIRSYC